MANIKEEDVHSVIYYDWVKKHKLDNIIYHIANERKDGWFASNLLKRKGVKAGVFDYCIDAARNGYHGLKIEIKIHPNKPSKVQIQFQKDVTKEGYLAIICWSYDEAIEETIDYLGLNIIHQRKPLPAR